MTILNMNKTEKGQICKGRSKKGQFWKRKYLKMTILKRNGLNNDSSEYENMQKDKFRK